jgi:hypothetical protein
VNGFRIFECDHGAKAIQGDLSESAILYLETDDGFTLAFVGITAELTVAAVLAVARFDAIRFDAERRLAIIRFRGCLLLHFCLSRHLPPPTGAKL